MRRSGIRDGKAFAIRTPQISRVSCWVHRIYSGQRHAITLHIIFGHLREDQPGNAFGENVNANPFDGSSLNVRVS